TEKQPNESQTPEKNYTSSVTISLTDTRKHLTQGNSPSTPILNNIITNITAMEGVGNRGNKQEQFETPDKSNKQLVVKSRSYRFPTIDYRLIKNLLKVHNFNNSSAAKTESRRLW
ncbi:3197_t:CDS:1, partial [Dentiscutata erythropus]